MIHIAIVERAAVGFSLPRKGGLLELHRSDGLPVYRVQYSPDNVREEGSATVIALGHDGDLVDVSHTAKSENMRRTAKKSGRKLSSFRPQLSLGASESTQPWRLLATDPSFRNAGAFRQPL